MPEGPPNTGDADATLSPDGGAGARTPPPRGVGPATERPGDQVGPYTLISQIGEGGFGMVWVAERRHPFTQRVALKLIKAGMDSKSVLARFEQERQALAVMNHPNIAKVLDGGMTPAGRPYFAMEYVKGEPVTEFCDGRKLSVKERLKLFAQACDAIQHAHLKGIVHRDLKPSNILAYEQDGKEPTLKVIDFGVAKAMSQPLTDKTIFTETGQMIGTPEYMSPEQADPSASDIDTRSDIYSLGVLLYELVTGSTPFDAKTLRSKGYGEIQRIIREEDPPSPSARLSTISTKDAELASRIEKSRGVALRELASQLKSELEWIPQKAMRKEPANRYQTAMALAEDVRAYLDGRPITAAPESTGYRVRKYVRRNRALVTGIAAVALALVAGLSLATWQWRVAVARASELKQVSDFQAKMLEQIDTTAAGAELVKDIRERFDKALTASGVPESERVGRQAAFGRDLSRVNATDAAAELIDRTILVPAVEAIDREFKEQPVVDAQLRQTLADLYAIIGRYEQAYPLQLMALEKRRRVLGEEHPNTLTSIINMGALLREQGKLAEGEKYFREALEKCRRVLGEEHPDTLGSIGNMGILLQSQGKLAEAEPFYREALEKRRRVLGEEHPDTLGSIGSMGYLLQSQGKLAEAEPYYREVLEKSRRVLGEEHPETLISINNMGSLLESQGKFAEAEPYYRGALEKQRRVLGEEHPDTIVSINNMGRLLNSQGKLAEAEPYLREALEKSRRVLGEEHPDTLGSIIDMCSLLESQGKSAEAEPYCRETLGKQRRVLGEEHPATLTSIISLGVLLQSQGKFSEAEPYFREGLEKRRRVLGEEHPDTLDCVNALARLYELWDAAAPGKGYGAKAVEWRSRLPAEAAKGAEAEAKAATPPAP